MTGKLKIAAGLLALISVALSTNSTAQTRVGLHSSYGNCVNCDLSGKDIPGMILRDANFSGSTFNRANLSGGKIYNSDLSGTHFKKAFLVKVEGHRVKLMKASMSDVTLVESRFRRSVFAHADLRRADLARASFLDTDFNEADLSSASAPEVDFTGSTFVGADFDHANLQETVLNNTVLKRVEFGNAIVRGAEFVGADLSGANLSNALGLTQGQLDTACGDPSTELPEDLTISYCQKDMTAENMFNHRHKPRKRPDHMAAKRIDRAVESLETLMGDMPSDEAVLRKNLQKIHSELVSARRQIEK